MAAKEADQEFVEYVVGKLVTKPEAVVTTRKIDELGVLIELTVDREDMGVIIGKEGKTAKAIRTLLRVLGAKSDSRINLKIVEPEGGEPREPREHRVDEVAKVEKDEKEEVTDEVETSDSAEATPDKPVEEATKPEVAEEDDDLMADLDI